MGKPYDSTVARAKKLYALTMEHYETENQSKCYKAIWRKYVYPAYGICYQTYLSYLRIARLALTQERQATA